MALKSVDNPRPRRGAFERSTPGVERSVVAGLPGDAAGALSRAASQFLVRGTRAQPLRRPGNPFESLLSDVDCRKQILETELTPWRMIASLEITSQHGLAYIGTGWFAAPRTLITAGHCVFDPVELGGWAREISVLPGRNGDEPPAFPAAASMRFSTTDRWLEAQEPDFDYAAIPLDTDLGSKVGTFGIGVLPDNELSDRLVNVSGYPVTPGDGKSQYFHANRIKALTTRRLFYDIDTMGGQSGSPVWAYVDDTTTPIVVGIHAYGVGGTPADLHLTANSGPRILPEVLDVIRGWIATGTPP
ncbi:MAG TPA: trypsin-like peptidase domain-containing protein [Vicinamibacterales bacterium]|nr:trypsin-like peptidase domain-containing protein [Vicinamibacterales bacterium]